MGDVVSSGMASSISGSRFDLKRIIAATLLVVLVAGSAVAQQIVDIPTSQPPNLGDLKQQVREYKRSGAYDRDLATVAAAAKAYVEQRASEVTKPALVLDIDETSLSNWPQLDANDFGYIPKGPCRNLPEGPCGVVAWDYSMQAKAIAPTLDLFNAAKAKGVSIFFITGRRDSERRVTEANLRKEGYNGWTGLVTRPQDQKGPVSDFKSGERAKIEAKGFTIIANMGDQPSDLAGGHAERGFLLPDPFYRIP
jgi:predicted secreted acid phosphatase